MSDPSLQALGTSLAELFAVYAEAELGGARPVPPFRVDRDGPQLHRGR